MDMDQSQLIISTSAAFDPEPNYAQNVYKYGAEWKSAAYTGSPVTMSIGFLTVEDPIPTFVSLEVKGAGTVVVTIGIGSLIETQVIIN